MGDYKQRLENVASLDELRSKTIAKLETEKKEAQAEISLCKSQLDESRCADGKVDTLQLLIEQRDQIMAEKDSELKVKTREVEAFAVQQEENRKKIHKLQEKLRDKQRMWIDSRRRWRRPRMKAGWRWSRSWEYML